MTTRNSKHLPDKIVDDITLDKWCRANIPGFMGVYSRTQLPTIWPSLTPGASVILNLDPAYKHGGTHWVGLRLAIDGPTVYYKDSFGAPPPSDVVHTTYWGNRGLLYGNKINQSMDESNCGRRAAEFLRAMARGAHKGQEIETFEKLEA